MQHKSNKNQQGVPVTSKHLLNAAQLLMGKVKDPAALVSFLVDSMESWNELTAKTSELKESSSDIAHLIRELLPAFTEGENRLNKAITCLKSYMDNLGYESLQEDLASIMMAYGYKNLEEGDGGPEYQAKELGLINVLFEMAHHLYYYEQERLNEKQAA